MDIQIIYLVKHMTGLITEVKLPRLETPRRWQIPYISLDDKWNLPWTSNTMVWLWVRALTISSVIYQYSIEITFRLKTSHVIDKYKVNNFLSLPSNTGAKKFWQISEMYFSNRRIYKLYTTCLRWMHLSKCKLDCST